jgi:transcriptional regulator with XRE-family HTH domain
MRKSSIIFGHGRTMATGRASAPWDAYARELGHNLLRARSASGLSQERAAHAAGISSFTYRKLEKGESNPGTPANPRLRTLVALAEVFGTTVQELIPQDGPGIAVGR